MRDDEQVNDDHGIEAGPGRRIARCGLCHLVQECPPVSRDERACCRRCGTELPVLRPSRLHLARALALGALALYVPANILPVALVNHQGAHLRFTIIDGIANLFGEGEIFVGLLVLTTSFLTPVLKILGLLFLAFAPPGRRLIRLRRRLYDLIRVLNPWNSMEVFLLATLLTLVDFGSLATIHAGVGALAFTAVVVMTTGGTMAFQPQALWSADPEP